MMHGDFIQIFTARIRRGALVCDENLNIDPNTGNFRCYDIICKVYSEVVRCCKSLRRFKQLHEERIIFTHINYIDCYRLYVLNHCDKINHSQKVLLNELLTGCIKKYVQLLVSDEV